MEFYKNQGEDKKKMAKGKRAGIKG